jgi:hypothetical protein
LASFEGVSLARCHMPQFFDLQSWNMRMYCARSGTFLSQCGRNRQISVGESIAWRSRPRESLARCWRSQVSSAATSTALVACRGTLRGREAVDLALDGEQGIDARDRLDRDRRLLQPCQIEELASPVRPSGRLDDRSALARGLVEPVEPGIGIRLHPLQGRDHPSARTMAVIRSRRVRDAGMGGLVQQPAALGAHRQHPAVKNVPKPT